MSMRTKKLTAYTLRIRVGENNEGEPRYAADLINSAYVLDSADDHLTLEAALAALAPLIVKRVERKLA